MPDNSDKAVKDFKDPLGTMLLDYLNGRRNVFVEVDSTTLDMWRMTGKTMFRNYSEMDDLERSALQLCRGKILDVGAGSGCHSLYLQQDGRRVDALDISPGCTEVMARRGVTSIIEQSLFSLREKRYTTILMLMNGLGICGTLDGCNLFLQFIGTILEDGGQVLADSTDLRSLSEATAEPDDPDDEYFGETEFVMRYRDIESEPFDWLYIDFNTLAVLADFNGWQCEQITTAGGGRYLARLF